MQNGQKGIFITAGVAVVAIVVLVAVGYRLNQAERQKAEEARQRALAAQAEAEQARQKAEESSDSLGRVSDQAALELVAKAARALDAQKWDEAREAADAAVELAPQLGAAWFEKGRATMQTAVFAPATVCFTKALGDAELDEGLRGRASRLLLLARAYARQQRARAELTMPQNAWLGQALRTEGEGALAAWFLKLGGEGLEAARAQVAAAAERLKKDNPELGPSRKPTVKQDEVEWDLRGQPKLTDLSALEGLPLTSLHIDGSSVADLSPLRGMPLAKLVIGKTPVADLSPLEGMPLRIISFGPGPVNSLAPLAGAPLELLHAPGVEIGDLSPLAGMPLQSLSFACRAQDLSALRDMPIGTLMLGGASETRDFGALATLKGLKRLQMFSAQISDLSVLEELPHLEWLELMSCHKALDISPLRKLPLKILDLGQAPDRTNIDALAGMDLERLNLDRTRVADLSALKGMKLKRLSVASYRPIHDFSVLEGMPLEFLQVGWMPHRWNAPVCLIPDTLGFLKDLKTLKQLMFGIRDKGDLKAYEQVLTVGAALRDANPKYEAGVFYRLQDGQITEVWMHDCGIADLSPLKGLKLTRLMAAANPIADLAPLTGMPLQHVRLWDAPATDLTALKGAPLVSLDLSGSKISDLTPVKAAPIEDLNLTGTKVTDYGQLKGMKLLKLRIDVDLPNSGIETLREMETLTHINDKEAGKFWQARDEAKD